MRATQNKKEDCAVFSYDEDGELERLSVWMNKKDACAFLNTTGLPKGKHVVLQEVCFVAPPKNVKGRKESASP